MTRNQKKLKELREAHEPRLAMIPDSTLRSHIEGRRPRGLDHLVVYESLGMPLQGWFSVRELKELGVPILGTDKEWKS